LPSGLFQPPRWPAHTASRRNLWRRSRLSNRKAVLQRQTSTLNIRLATRNSSLEGRFQPPRKPAYMASRRLTRQPSPLRHPNAAFPRQLRPCAIEPGAPVSKAEKDFQPPRTSAYTLRRRGLFQICRPLLVPWSKTATPMATEHYNQNTGCLYSLKNLLVCGAQFARTHNTLVFMRTRKPRSVERQKKPPAFLRFRHQGADSWLAALFARELLIRADTAHCVSGCAPFGGAAQLER